MRSVRFQRRFQDRTPRRGQIAGRVLGQSTAHRRADGSGTCRILAAESRRRDRSEIRLRPFQTAGKILFYFKNGRGNAVAIDSDTREVVERGSPPAGLAFDFDAIIDA
jgi:hypothetical protein